MEAKKNYDYERLSEVVSDLHGVGIPELTAKLVERTNKKAMYYRWDGVWEVFRIKIKEEGIVFDKSYPKREVYPGNEDFGSTAWCFKDEKLARERYNAI